jgi:HlyD family secretion protein
MPFERTSVLPLALLCCACSVTRSAGPAPTPAGPAAPAPAAPQAPAAEAITGTIAPAAFGAVSLWPRAWSGEFLVLEALPQGARVAQGDVLVRLDVERIDEQIRQAELELRSAEVAHAGLLERHALSTEAAADELAQARARLDRANRSLAAFKEQGLEHERRGDELRARYEQQGIEDRVDELAQVEAMYEADELVDATEEIVLKRSRRDLESARLSNALAADRRALEAAVTRPMQLEQREEEVVLQQAAVARLVRSQAVDARAREDAAARSLRTLEDKREALARLRADRELFTLRAPGDGVLLYGKAEDYRPGGKPPVVERGSRLSARGDVLLVADPRRLAVTFDLSELQRAAVAPGAAARVRPLSLREALEGTLEVEDFPAARPAGKDGALFAARVLLEPGDHGLAIGMQARVELEGGGAP